jgi:monoamine oxidase
MKYRTNIADRLAAIKALPQQPSRSVAIIGAGMAGLVAATELTALGHRVTLIEATNRAGGRVQSWRPAGVGGPWHEFGAMRIPAAHDHTRHYIEMAGLTGKLKRFVTVQQDGDAYYFLKGKRFRMSEAGSHIPQLYELPPPVRAAIETIKPTVPEKERLTVPGILLGALFGPIMTSLTIADEKALLFEGPPTAKSAELESTTLGDALTATFDAASEAMTLAGVSTGLEVWWHKSIANFVREEILKDGVPFQELTDGLDQLPTALAAKLGGAGQIRYCTAVTAIHNHAAGVELQLRRTEEQEGHPPQWVPMGDVETLDCDYVLCTAPFGVLRGIAITGVSNEKMAAIRGMNYASSAKVLLHCSKRLWEADEIDGGASVSDTILRQTYYPSDHFVEEAAFAPDADPAPSGGTLFRVEHPLPKSDAAAFAAADRSDEPGILVASYSWGQDARRMGSMPHAERVAACLAVLETIHPGISDKVTDTASCFWDEQLWARGAFAMPHANEVPTLMAAGQKAEGRLFFAGEHLSFNPGWIQGAIISSLNAVHDLLSQ